MAIPGREMFVAIQAFPRNIHITLSVGKATPMHKPKKEKKEKKKKESKKIRKLEKNSAEEYWS